jgi:hypothetical protein
LHWVDLFDDRGYQRLLRSLEERASQVFLKQDSTSKKPPHKADHRRDHRAEHRADHKPLRS